LTYTETITRGGETHTGALTDLAALRLVQRGRHLGYQVTAAKDGAVTIVRKRGDRPIVTVVVRPHVRAAHLTGTQHADLELIRLALGRAEYRGAGRIGVEASLAGRLAMAAYEHRVYTVGGYDPVDDGERFDSFTGARVQSYGWFATALCSCGAFSSVQTERVSARHAARAPRRALDRGSDRSLR
jgi:hypothetical protein